MTRGVGDHPRKDKQQRQADKLNPARNLDARRAPDRAHGSDRTARIVPLRPPDWDWSFGTDGALALKEPIPSATVPEMSPPVTHRRARVTHRRRLDRERRLRRLAVLVAVATVALVTLLLSAFGGSGSPAQAPAPASASRLLPAGPPFPEIVARLGTLHLQLPVSQSRVTAIGYQGGSSGSLALSPLGRQANEGPAEAARALDLRRLERPPALVPAARRRRPLALRDRRRRGCRDRRLLAGRRDDRRDRRRRPERRDVRIAHRHPAVGRTVARRLGLARARRPVARRSARRSPPPGSKLGSVVDFTHAERQALARYTNDAGNHVVVEVHPSATLAVG